MAAKTKKRENPMSVRSKSALSQALLSLMLQKDFNEISIQEITNRAGLSRQTFYTNFEKKEDILKYLLNCLFDKYLKQLEAQKITPEYFMIDYLAFWDDSRDFLTLLFRRGMGYLFQERNRIFFNELPDSIVGVLCPDEQMRPYIKAGLAGLTYELLYLTMSDGQGLSIDVLTALADNLFTGRIFSTSLYFHF